jgi:pimeloyl-ACP methyl ester carboxylesterase
MAIMVGAARAWRLTLIGLVLVVAGSILAAMIQSTGGVKVSDVRFRAADGAIMSALLYTPPNATAEHPAPGILAVHGYINTRETQDAFAIEFARRGYVVLAMDQRGHGYSGGGATTKGFGGPDGLAYLRTLPMVDKDRIGLEGHSMGGWTVLAAAKAMPDAYKAVVLEGSSTGRPFAAEGTPDWPRNVAVVFSRLDEFGPLMWGVPKSADVGASKKLQALFGTAELVAPEKLYGDVAAGTARALYQPAVTHPGDHISTVAVGHAVDWFARTLGQPRPVSGQIWMWKEIGTLIALVGFFVLLLGVFDVLLGLPFFAHLKAEPAFVRERAGGAAWWALLLLGAFIPAVSFILLPLSGRGFVPQSIVFPQGITNQLIAWAVANAIAAALVGLALRARPSTSRVGPLPAMLIAVATVAVGYVVVWLAGKLLTVDFRFWVVALKPLSLRQALAALAYLIPFAVFLVIAFRGLASLTARGQSAAAQYATAIAGLALGFAVVVAIAYATLFATGTLPGWAPALNAIVAIQFVPLLAALGVIFAFTWRRTGSYLPGALIASLFVSWYVVAGQATHFVAS